MNRIIAFEKSISQLEEVNKTLKGNCEVLEHKVTKRDEQLRSAKDKVAEVVGTCYSEMSRMGNEISQHKTVINRMTAEKEQYTRQKEKQVADLQNAISRLMVEKEEYKKSSEEIKARIELMQCTQKSEITKEEDPANRENPKLQELLSTIFSTIKEG